MSGSGGKSVVQLLRELPRTNCGDCRLPTCLSFATAVSQGTRAFGECPHVEHEAVPVSPRRASTPVQGPGGDGTPLEQLKAQMPAVDFDEAAQRLGVELTRGRLVFLCLRRRFEVDQQGELHSECHVNDWVHYPLLDHILHGGQRPPEGRWVAFQDLADSADWHRYFDKRCVGDMQRLVDGDPQFFFDMLDLFGGRPPQPAMEADFSSVLRPLPRLPLLFAYWAADGPFPAKLALRFDPSATANVTAPSLFSFVRGMLEMFKAIGRRHSGLT